ncbi:hypothetical protein [Dyella sp. EPa41]|uniref:hypothetical protein n=1 Tax=Dyella sp. EPa41 TaxID=1561194 RepID=UPI001916693E|nr:hypothetical protein [Dyella sp. EPa41]
MFWFALEPGAPANAFVGVTVAGARALAGATLRFADADVRVINEAAVAFLVGNAALGGGGGAGNCVASAVRRAGGVALAVDVGSEIAANASMALTTRDPSARGAKGANLVMANPRCETESMRGRWVHTRMAENAIHIPIAQAPDPAVGKPRFPSVSLRSRHSWAEFRFSKYAF